MLRDWTDGGAKSKSRKRKTWFRLDKTSLTKSQSLISQVVSHDLTLGQKGWAIYMLKDDFDFTKKKHVRKDKHNQFQSQIDDDQNSEDASIQN